MSLPGIRTALNVESGMQYLQQTAAAYPEEEDYDGDSAKG
jgi:rsbT antagonist protein RsbS